MERLQEMGYELRTSQSISGAKFTGPGGNNNSHCYQHFFMKRPDSNGQTQELVLKLTDKLQEQAELTSRKADDKVRALERDVHKLREEVAEKTKQVRMAESSAERVAALEAEVGRLREENAELASSYATNYRVQLSQKREFEERLNTMELQMQSTASEAAAKATEQERSDFETRLAKKDQMLQQKFNSMVAELDSVEAQRDEAQRALRASQRLDMGIAD